MELTVSTRDRLVQLLTSEYSVPDELVDCVKVAIKQYSTKNYTDDAIDRMVRTPQSLSKGLALLRERNGKNDLSLFRGIISEWLVCAEYNALKNKGAVVMTITNPDPSSKADLLHIVDTGKGYKAVPGPDIKSGGSTYVFNQWKKIVKYRYEIPMVDIDGILTTEEGIKQLTQKQHEEFEELSALYPNKRPLDTAFEKADINRVVADYLKYVEFNILPSTVSDLSIKDASVSRIKEKLYSGEVLNGQSYDWNVYSSESKEILQPITEEIKLNSQGRNVGSNDTMSGIDSKSYQKQTIEHRLEGDIGPDSAVDKGMKFARGLGGHIKKGGLRVIKFIRENPDVVVATLSAIASVVAMNSSDSKTRSNANFSDQADYENDYVSDKTSTFDNRYNNVEISAPENNNTHNYPEHRKDPAAHAYRRNGIVVGARGGTAEERAAIRKEHGLE
ncbi:TPA: hypothetical protein U2D09_000426 [Streptococcus suis]|nr:hypothetical protein [Streptococcus suis]HEM6372704.1 hypothetical protein [Streptococcus suis]